MYLAGALGAAVWVFAFFPLLDTESAWLIALATIVGLALHAAMYGPQAAFITELFGTEVRYSGASLGYQLAGILGGALAPIISIALLDRFGTTTAVSLYVVAALVFTVVALLVARETAAVDLDEDGPTRPGASRGCARSSTERSGRRRGVQQPRQEGSRALVLRMLDDL